MPDPQRSELGDFLRSRRESLTPETGRPAGRAAAAHAGPAARGGGRTRRHRRRLVHPAGAGPRRQPVGHHHRCAGPRASPEQDRTCPSAGAGAQRRRAAHSSARRVPTALRRVWSKASNQPAYITGRRWDILAWNAAASDIFGDFGRLAGGRPQYPALHAHQSRRAAPVRRSLGRGGQAHGRRSSARRTICGPATRPSSTCWTRLRRGQPRVRRLVGHPRRPQRRLRPEAAAAPQARTVALRIRDLSGQRRPGLKLIIYTEIG